MPVSPGRPKGVPNKLNMLLKDAILMAAQGAHKDGMVGYLQQQANENPGPFLTLLGKVLPTDVNTTIRGKVIVVIGGKG